MVESLPARQIKFYYYLMMEDGVYYVTTLSSSSTHAPCLRPADLYCILQQLGRKKKRGKKCTSMYVVFCTTTSVRLRMMYSSSTGTADLFSSTNHVTMRSVCR